jgi:hypothetical protein
MVRDDHRVLRRLPQARLEAEAGELVAHPFGGAHAIRRHGPGWR